MDMAMDGEDVSPVVYGNLIEAAEDVKYMSTLRDETVYPYSSEAIHPL